MNLSLSPTLGIDSLKAKDIRLFYPDIEDTLGANSGIMIVGYHIVYKDIFVFTDYLIYLAKVRVEDKL